MAQRLSYEGPRGIMGVMVPSVLLALVGMLVAVFLLGTRHSSTIELQVQDDHLDIHITGKDAIYALSRGMHIPLSSIRGIAVAPTKNVPRTGLRLPGTGVPGVLRAGSYGTSPTRDFWLVRRADEVLVVELEPGEPYRRIVLELPNPRDVCLRLRPATGAYTGTFET